LKEILTKVAALNLHERNFLQSSAIARTNKTFTMELESLNTGTVRWTKLKERDGVEVEEEKIIPPRLVDYIPRLVSDIKLTVDLNHCNKLNELAAVLINLPDWFDDMGASLELIDKPNNLSS